jgi:putative sterol carrier protein
VPLLQRFESRQTFPSLQANGIFELQVTNNASETVTWTIDLKKTGTVFKGKAQPKADVTIILSDDTLVDLATGKVSQFAVTLFLFLIQVIVISS